MTAISSSATAVTTLISLSTPYISSQTGTENSKTLSSPRFPLQDPLCFFPIKSVFFYTATLKHDFTTMLLSLLQLSTRLDLNNTALVFSKYLFQYCTSSIAAYQMIPQFSSSEQQTCIISVSASGIQAWLSWVLRLRVYHEAPVQVSAGMQSCQVKAYLGGGSLLRLLAGFNSSGLLARGLPHFLVM